MKTHLGSLLTKTIRIAFIKYIALLCPVIADAGVANPYEAEEIHLKLERGFLTTPAKYIARIRETFAEGFAENVILRVYEEASSFQRIVGIRKTNAGYEAFVMIPSSSIYYAEMNRQRESGEIKVYDTNGDVKSPETDHDFQANKQRYPANVTVRIESTIISANVANSVSHAWRVMLLDAEPPTGKVTILDGIQYDFQMRIKDHGFVSATITSPHGRSRTKKLVNLADALSDYAKKETDASSIINALKQ